MKVSNLKPCVIWFTGLPAAGKTSLANALADHLRPRNIPLELLDGDVIRSVFPQTGFTKEERNAHVCRVGFMASRLEAHGVTSIVALVSPYEEARTFARNLCQNFIEVYVSTPLAVCESRDPKGHYKMARRGEIKNFTGVNDPYESPTHPELVIDTSQTSIEDAVGKIMDLIPRS